ncbi:MAG: phosphotransferase family protein [Caulobacterales bacterium]|nr:phosphotransferase family protein [Caulobacterales bacterium]
MDIEKLNALAPKLTPGGRAVSDLKRLSGGASQETWSFKLATPEGEARLILRRAPESATARTLAISLETEARLMRMAGEAGVPSPRVLHVLAPKEGLGAGFFMAHVEGEALGGKIVRDAAFADTRPMLARQCGEILARIHALAPPADLPVSGAAHTIDELERAHREEGWPRPVFELAFRWLRANLPADASLTLVHGDFRNGNLLIGADGVRAVLDWELAHVGDPMQDLGWLCVNSWRFGAIEKPVGGFGERQDLFAGYEAVSGVAVDPARVRFWEVLGVLRWGIICTVSTTVLREAGPFAIDRPMIARRASETELDLLDLLEAR